MGLQLNSLHGQAIVLAALVFISPNLLPGYPTRMTLLWRPPGSGKTILLLALDGKLGSDVKQHLRTVETARSISKITTNFFDTLDIHASRLSKIMEQSGSMHDQQLCELEKKFEESAANEERQLLEKVAEMLASSNARQKKLVQTAVHNIRNTAADRASDLQTEMSTAHDFTSSVRKQWTAYMEETEDRYLEDNAAVETGKQISEECLQ